MSTVKPLRQPTPGPFERWWMPAKTLLRRVRALRKMACNGARDMNVNLANDIIDKITELLGREPRGLEDVVVSDSSGAPAVIRVASLVDDKPFPTLFWLVDPVLCYRIDQLEASGLIAQFQRQIDTNPGLQRRMREDHRAHIALRESYLPPPVRQRLQELGLGDALADRGIGGISNFTRIRCLHTWYGAHMVVPNTVGAMLNDWWFSQSP